jgi:hypothetical protein
MNDTEANVRETERMLNFIAERSGEDRASVFLDIIIHLLFSKDDPANPPHSGLALIRSSVARQQHVLNEIAAIYRLTAPTLKYGEPAPGDPEEIPF